MFYGTYNIPLLVRCTSQVHLVVPRRLFPLECYGPPHLFPVGQVVWCCIKIIHVSAWRLTVMSVNFIVSGAWGLLSLVGVSCPIVVGGSPYPHFTVLWLCLLYGFLVELTYTWCSWSSFYSWELWRPHCQCSGIRDLIHGRWCMW